MQFAPAKPVVTDTAPSLPPAPVAMAGAPAVTWARVLGPGIAAIRQMWLPFLLLQLCGLCVVIAYFRLPQVRAWCDELAAIKRQGGYAFSLVAMALCAGVLPEVCKYITGIDRRIDKGRGRTLLFMMALYGTGGVLVDAFYRVMAALFGSGLHVLIIAPKVLIDQFVYTPVIGVGLIATGFAWRRLDYDTRTFVRRINTRWYVLTVVPMLLPAWAYWIPMTSLMYALPGGLTFVYGAIASGAISLLYASIAGHDDAPAAV